MKAAREYPIVTVTAKGTRWLESGHPWVYDSDVAREPDDPILSGNLLIQTVSVFEPATLIPSGIYLGI